MLQHRTSGHPNLLHPATPPRALSPQAWRTAFRTKPRVPPSELGDRVLLRASPLPRWHERTPCFGAKLATHFAARQPIDVPALLRPPPSLRHSTHRALPIHATSTGRE